MSKNTSPRVRGFALIVVVAVLGVGALFGLVAWLNAQSGLLDREQQAQQTLATAKTALLAFSASQVLNPAWPGDLPCPDTNNDGLAGPGCGSGTLGRLPWHTLGLGVANPDNANDPLGSRLWYALSDNFRSNHPHCTPPCRNSDTPGTITVRDVHGSVQHDAQAGTGAVAVILLPGAPLQRLDGLQQSRAAANALNPRHYLDNLASEDNANFVVGGSNGFFLGPARDATGNLIANDRAIVITQADIDRHMRLRVAAEVARCLQDYMTAHGRKLPWLVPLTDTVAYQDQNGLTFGRLPLNMTASRAADASLPATWGFAATQCRIQDVGTAWWQNWRDQVFVAIAPGCAPGAGGAACPGTGLTVDGKPGQAYAVMVAGRALAGQNRSIVALASNYLEGANADLSSPFATCASAACNDLVRSGE